MTTKPSNAPELPELPEPAAWHDYLLPGLVVAESFPHDVVVVNLFTEAQMHAYALAFRADGVREVVAKVLALHRLYSTTESSDEPATEHDLGYEQACAEFAQHLATLAAHYPEEKT